MKVLFNRRGIIYNTDLKDSYRGWSRKWFVSFRKNKETKFTYHKNLNIVSKKFEIKYDSLYHAFPSKKEPVYYILDMQTKDSDFFVVNVKASKAQFWDGFINLKTNQIAYYTETEFYNDYGDYYEEEILVEEKVDFIFKSTPYKDVNGNTIFEGDIVINDINPKYVDTYIVTKTNNGYILKCVDGYFEEKIEEFLDCEFYRCIKFETSDF